MLAPLLPPYYSLYKIHERWQDFLDAGWSPEDLVARKAKDFEYHGLAWGLAPWHDIGRIWPWCCEILSSTWASGERVRLTHWRGKPQLTLLHEHGKKIVPPGMRLGAIQ